MPDELRAKLKQYVNGLKEEAYLASQDTRILQRYPNAPVGHVAVGRGIVYRSVIAYLNLLLESDDSDSRSSQ